MLAHIRRPSSRLTSFRSPASRCRAFGSETSACEPDRTRRQAVESLATQKSLARCAGCASGFAVEARVTSVSLVGSRSGRVRRASCAIPSLSLTATQDEGAASRRARLGEHDALGIPAGDTWDMCETREMFAVDCHKRNARLGCANVLCTTSVWLTHTWAAIWSSPPRDQYSREAERTH